MSSRTPTECIDLSTDTSANEIDRKDAIRALQRANECDELAELVRTSTLDDQYRRVALEALATPQCDSTLEILADDDSLDHERRDAAQTLLVDHDSDW